METFHRCFNALLLRNSDAKPSKSLAYAVYNLQSKFFLMQPNTQAFLEGLRKFESDFRSAYSCATQSACVAYVFAKIVMAESTSSETFGSLDYSLRLELER